MSRSRKGSKGPGYEYWSRRYPSCASPSKYKYGKKLTHRYERRMGEAQTKEISENLGEEYIGYYGDKTGRWLYDGDGDVEDLYPFSCSHPNSGNWQGDLRNG